MKSSSSLREAIIRAHDRGKTQHEIADFLGIALETVNKAIKRFEITLDTLVKIVDNFPNRIDAKSGHFE